MVRQFKWIDWNLQKIDAHGLSVEEVEAAFDRVFSLPRRFRRAGRCADLRDNRVLRATAHD